VDNYSRFIAYLKVLLPTAALGLFSTVFFLWSPKFNEDNAIPYTHDEIIRRINHRQATTPLYLSTTAKGHNVRINADHTYLGEELSLPIAEEVTGQLDFIDGSIVTLSADRAVFEEHSDLVNFSGNVVLNSTEGITLESDQLTTNIVALTAYSDVPVRASSALGELRSGNMRITTIHNSGHLKMFFGNGVKLTYVP
jgi:lipopolysaccharide export system protein LptC